MRAQDSVSARIGGASLILLFAVLGDSVYIFGPYPSWGSFLFRGTVAGLLMLLLWYGTDLLIYPEVYAE